MSKRAWEVGDVVEYPPTDEVTVTAWWYTGEQRIVELSNAIAMPQQKWEEAGWHFVQKEQAMNERAWEVGDWLVRRPDGRRGSVVATRVDVLESGSGFEGLLVISLGENCIAAKQSVLQFFGWELWKGLEQ